MRLNLFIPYTRGTFNNDIKFDEIMNSFYYLDNIYHSCQGSPTARLSRVWLLPPQGAGVRPHSSKDLSVYFVIQTAFKLSE